MRSAVSMWGNSTSRRPRTACGSSGSSGPQVIVNAAAYTDVDGCETNRDACFAVNAEGVRNIACACKDSGAKIVHYSTDYVFDGTKGEPYLEDDPCRPINTYGASKRRGEELLIETAENHVLIRTAWLYGRQGKNFVKAILAKARDEGSAAGRRRPGGLPHLQLRSRPGDKTARRTGLPGHLSMSRTGASAAGSSSRRGFSTMPRCPA